MGNCKMKIVVINSRHILFQWSHSINIVKITNAFHKVGQEIKILTAERFLEEKIVKR